MRKSVFVIAVIAVVAFAAVAIAQTTTTEIRRAAVVAVYGNHVVVRGADGVDREHEVPEGFTFNIDGKDLTVDQLKPGMILTATITTTTAPEVVHTEVVKKGEVLKVVGRTLMVRTPEGVKTFRDVPSDFVFWVDGQEKTIYDLREGMHLTATIVSEQAVETTKQDISVTGTSAAIEKAAEVKQQKAAAAAAASASTTTASQTLPKTGSTLPLAGLAGLMLLALAGGIAVARRFV